MACWLAQSLDFIIKMSSICFGMTIAYSDGLLASLTFLNRLETIMENGWKMWANIFQPASRPIEKEMRSTTGSRCVKEQHQAIGLAPEKTDGLM